MKTYIRLCARKWPDEEPQTGEFRVGNPQPRNSPAIHKCQRSNSGEKDISVTLCAHFLTCLNIMYAQHEFCSFNGLTRNDWFTSHHTHVLVIIKNQLHASTLYSSAEWLHSCFGFKSLPGDQLSWLRFSRFSSVSPGKCRDNTLN
jgi:hypothetical protein